MKDAEWTLNSQTILIEIEQEVVCGMDLLVNGVVPVLNLRVYARPNPYHYHRLLCSVMWVEEYVK